MNVQIEDSWKAHLQPEFDKDYFYTLTNFVREEYGKYAIYPPGKLIFNAFNLCPFDKVKVVIIGQDPYHGPGQAHGLCFSVNEYKDQMLPFFGKNTDGGICKCFPAAVLMGAGLMGTYGESGIEQ